MVKVEDVKATGLPTREIPEDYEQNPRWGQPKQEGARELSRYEYYFGPKEQHSGFELFHHGLRL